jgi:3-dehydro-L-gulonate 2-dehydrogenase
MLRIPESEVRDTLRSILETLGFAPDDAALCAKLFAETSRDGVHSHGLDRFPRFVRMVRDGFVDPRRQAVFAAGAPPMERWDGLGGPGNLNAHRCMERAIALAREHGIGLVALANTNHWMRGGSYGWQAAEAGMLAICWTNTMPNLPPWGAREPRIGNNPLVFAVPRAGGHVVLDTAVSQFSYGALETHQRQGRKLAVPGGFDGSGQLTDDPGAILESARLLPIGYWKGSGLSLLLDLFAALLSGGRATHEIPADPLRESGVSQVFIVMDPAHLGADEWLERVVSEVVRDYCGEEPDAGTRYPGERVMRHRAEAQARGIPVDPEVWAAIQGLGRSPDDTPQPGAEPGG